MLREKIWQITLLGSGDHLVRIIYQEILGSIDKSLKGIDIQISIPRALLIKEFVISNCKTRKARYKGKDKVYKLEFKGLHQQEMILMRVEMKQTNESIKKYIKKLQEPCCLRNNKDLRLYDYKIQPITKHTRALRIQVQLTNNSTKY